MWVLNILINWSRAFHAGPLLLFLALAANYRSGARIEWTTPSRWTVKGMTNVLERLTGPQSPLISWGHARSGLTRPAGVCGVGAVMESVLLLVRDKAERRACPCPRYLVIDNPHAHSTFLSVHDHSGIYKYSEYTLVYFLQSSGAV